MDGGATFEVCVGGYQTTQFYAGFSCSRQNPEFAMGGLQDNSTVLYVGSKAWLRAIGGDGAWTAIDASDDSIIYGSYQYLSILRSEDRGETWESIPFNPISGVGFIAPYALGGPSEPEVMYLGTKTPRKSLDGGLSNTVLNGGLSLDRNIPLTIAVSQSDSRKAYYTTAPIYDRAGVFVTEDGDHFRKITGSLPDRYPLGLAIDPNDDDVVYVTFGGFGTSHVFRSRDAGDTWEDIGQALPDIPTLSVIVDPLLPDRIYVGTDIGVFLSRDDGQSWVAFDQGLPEAAICMDLDICESSGLLRVATYGNGVYQRWLERLPSDARPVSAAAAFGIRRISPNPFNPVTTISFGVSRPGVVTVAIHDPAGRRVRTLQSGFLEGGAHRLNWDGRLDSGRPAPSGVYLCRLECEGRIDVQRLTLIK